MPWKGDFMRNTAIFIPVSVALATVFLAGCTQSQQPAQPTPVVTSQTTADTIKVADSSLGRILTDTKDMTLYYFIHGYSGKRRVYLLRKVRNSMADLYR